MKMKSKFLLYFGVIVLNIIRSDGKRNVLLIVGKKIFFRDCYIDDRD